MDIQGFNETQLTADGASPGRLGAILVFNLSANGLVECVGSFGCQRSGFNSELKVVFTTPGFSKYINQVSALQVEVGLQILAHRPEEWVSRFLQPY